MLKLKRVELQGFKSFPDRTELRFDGAGIAAIVGPNGCGKSNLADAVNWVLGEQSAKTLRGSRMEDVIFAGTRDRKPLSLASVTMTLVEPPDPLHIADQPGKANGSPVNGKGAPAQPRDITITRRLFRSGDSEYLIDGRLARLRDIQDIFMGTGLGPEHYAIIEQGRIGQILSSKPQDRRLVIEEAAGVSRFKAKRRLAEAKLEGAKHNLERVFDILEEVGRQANSLKRQAAKARRYEDLKAQMNGQLRLALAARYRMLEREAAKIALDLNLATSGLQSLASQVAEGEQAHGRTQAAAYETEARLTEARGRLAELNLALERTRGRLESQAQQIETIDQRLSQGETESRDLDARLAALTEEAAAHRQALDDLESQTRSARERLERKDQEREGIQNAVADRELAIENSRQTVLRLLGETASLRNQLAQIDEYLAAIERDTAKALREDQTASSDLEWLGQARKELSEQAAERQMELATVTDERRTVEADLGTTKEEATATRRELERLRTEFADLKARRDSLEEILSHHAYTTEAVKRLFTAIERGQAQGLKPQGVLADFVEVEPAYEKAAEEFLHEELEYVLVEDWRQAECGLELMRGALEGRVTFLVHPPPDARPAPAPGLDGAPGVTGRLSDVLRLTNGLGGAALQCLPRLACCFLAADREAAQRLALAHPDFYFLLPDGICYHGHAVSGGRKTSSGPLALKRELRELKAQTQSRNKQLEETAARLEKLEAEIAGLEREVERLRGTQQAQEREALAIDHEMKKLAEELARAGSRLSVARLELERLGRERERSAGQRESNLRAVEEKERLRQQHEQALHAARVDLERLKTEAARCVEEHSSLRVELAGFEERRRAEAAAMARLESQVRELSGRRGETGGEMERLGAERARLAADNIEMERKIVSLNGEISEAEAAVERLAAEEVSLRQELAALEEKLKRLRAEAQAAQESRSQIEVDLVRRQAELRFLDETSRKELNAPAAELETAEEIPLDTEGVAAAEQRYQEIKARIDALGPVNPEALQQYREAQERYNFLNVQRQDLLDSIRDTEKAIQDIDAESRKRFTDAFTAINAHFRELFRTLFNGGTGEMRLADENNAAESGIEIVASPPGKRLQNVLLLSGGEKALTALALLLAIFKFQPSSFCILDEVDAPLDDPNIERLMRLVGQMAGQTQFILITHAKRTMEAAQALYGVTMQEPGVSKLVSVRFENPPPPPPPAAPVEYAPVT